MTMEEGLMDNPRALHALRRFWEEISQGRPATPADLDPELAALVERLHTTPDVPPPNAMYARHLREHLMHTAAVPLAPPIGVPANGRALSPPTRGLLPPLILPQRPRRAWPVAQVAIIVLLIAAMAAMLYAISLRPQHEPATAPSVATPMPAASNDWPMYRGNPARNGATTSPGPDGQPIVLWQYPARGSAWHSPAVADGVAYLQSGDGVVQALDATTGEVRWQVTIGAIEDTPTVAGDTLVLNSGTGVLIALDRASGAEQWRFEHQVAAKTTPLVVEGTVYIGSDDGTVFALDLTTGEEQWSTHVGGAISRSLAFTEGRLYVPMATGTLQALDATSGAEQWHMTGENPDDFVGTPAVADGVIYFGLSGKLHAVNAATGEEQWSIAYAGTPSAAAAGSVVSSDADGVVHAFDAATGAERWTFATDAAVQAAPLIAANTVYVASLDHTLYALDLATGSEQWAFALDGAADYGPSLANGVLYIGTDSGTLYALGGSGTAQLTAPREATPVAATPAAGETRANAAVMGIPAEVTEPTLVHIWTRSKAAGDFAGNAAGVAIDPFSRIWVCNDVDSSLDIFDRDGNKLQHLAGGKGSAPGQWNWQIGTLNQGAFWVGCAMAFAPDGTAYITDAGNQRVQVLAPDGTLKTTWSTADPDKPQLQGPIAISRLANGEFLITDFATRDVIRRFSADGQFLGMFEPGEGVVQTYWDPVSTLVDQDGNIWVTEFSENRVVKLTSEGELLLAIGGPNPGSQPGKFREPMAMALDAQGNIYVADDDNSRLQVFDANGTFLAAFTGAEAGMTRFGDQGGGFPNIVAGGGGYFFVTDYADDDLVGEVRLMKLQVLLPVAPEATPMA